MFRAMVSRMSSRLAMRLAAIFYDLLDALTGQFEFDSGLPVTLARGYIGEDLGAALTEVF